MSYQRTRSNAQRKFLPVLPSAKKVIAALTLLLALSACAFLQPRSPKSLGEQQSSYSYIPLDPLPVMDAGSKQKQYVAATGHYAECEELKSLLECLPDQAVRIAVGQYDVSGNLVFGPAKIGTQGNSYQIILDYVSVDVNNISVYIQRILLSDGQDVSVYDDRFPPRSTQYRVYKDPDTDLATRIELLKPGQKPPPLPKGDKVVIPVYVGVGLRLTAAISVTKGTANLSSLGSIAADAQAGKITGSLIVQTLGITGKSVSTTLPLPSELNQTTIQNAILALGSIKAVLYDTNTLITPRVVGIYNPVGGGQQVVNGIISLLASDPIHWYRPCARFPGQSGQPSPQSK